MSRLALLSSLLAWSLSAVADEPSRRTPRVLLIGIDGCRPDALLKAKAPALHGLIESGAFSDQAQTGDITVSGPGWSSFLTGVWREKHGVRDNKFEGANFREHPALFERIKKARPQAWVGSVVQWSPIKQHIATSADLNAAYKTDDAVVRAACEVLGNKDPDLLFVHLDDVDHAGHKHGFHPEQAEYLAAIAKTDDRVGDILKAMRSRKSFARENWLVLVSTDHGGSGKIHGQNIPEHRTIFIIVTGGTAMKGRLAPAPTVVDLVPTALGHLGVAIHPPVDGRPLADAKP